MKRPFIVLLMAFIYLGVLFTPASAHASQHILSEEYISVVSADTRPIAQDRLVYFALNQTGCHAEITCLPAQTGLELANAGERDGVITLMADIGQLYPNLIQIPVPLDRADIYAVARQGHEAGFTGAPRGWEGLSGKRVGMIAQRQYIALNIPGDANVIIKESNKLLLDGLINGEYDMAILTQRAHETMDLPQGIERAFLIDSLNEYLYLNKSKKDLLPGVTQALEDMLLDGRAEAILNDLPFGTSQKTILHVISSNMDSAIEEQFNIHLRDRFRDDDSLDWYSVALETNRFPVNEIRISAIAQLLRHDCVSRNVAAIVVSGPDALRFIDDNYNLMFRNVPVIYYGVDPGADVSALSNAPYYVRVVEDIPAFETTEAALGIFPDTEKIYVINDYSSEGIQERLAINDALAQYSGKIEVEFSANTSRQALLNELNSLPKNTLVLTGSYSRDSQGRYYTPGDMTRALEEYCNVPIFTMYHTSLGLGSIGGKCADYGLLGDTVANLLTGLLEGGLSNAPIQVKYYRWVFDKNVMLKWGIEDAELPPGAEIINRTPSIMESNPRFAFSIIALFIAIVAVLVCVTVFYTRLNKQREQLRTAHELLAKDERIREVKERLERVINTAPLSFMMTMNGIVLETNEYMSTHLGIKPDDDANSIYDDPSMGETLIKQAYLSKIVENQIIRLKLKGGGTARFLANASAVEYDKQTAHVLWAMDIEESETQKDSLLKSRREIREVRDRLESMINTSPVAYTLCIDGIIQQTNEYMREHSGMKPGEDIRGYYTYPEQRDPIIKRVVEGELLVGEIIWYKMANGENHRFLSNLSTVEYNGETAILQWAMDIEEFELQSDALRASRERLEETNQRLEQMIATAPIYFTLSIEGEIRELNDNVRVDMGLEAGDYARSIYVDPSERDNMTRRALAGEIIQNEIVKIRFANGEIHRCLLNASAAEYEGKRAVVAWAVDIEEGERKKDQLLAAQRGLQLMLDTMPAPICVTDYESGILIYGNDAFIKMAEIDSPELVFGLCGLEIFAGASQEESARVSGFYKAASSSPEAYMSELTLRTAAGKIRDVRVSARRIEFFEKKAMLFIMTDLAVEKGYKSMQENLQMILDIMPVPLGIMNTRDNKIIYLNNASSDLFGFDGNDEILGEPVTGLFPTYQPDGVLSLDKVVKLNQPEPTSAEMIGRKTDGSEMEILLTACLIDYMGTDAALGIIKDLSLEKGYERMLLNMAQKEKEANELKSRFLVNMSHEIRTPMNAIIGLTEIELRKNPQRETMDIYKKINDSAKNLLNIINDILDLSKIEADKMELYEDEFDLEDVINSALLMASPRLEGKNVEFMLKTSLDLPRYIVGDRTRLWQILKNFLDNAAKYTHKGKITLSAWEDAQLSDEKNVYIRFRVSDTGIGMTDEELKKVFMPYEQVYNDAQKTYAGTGLGMHISKQMCELMKGELTVESKVGVGTDVFIGIPFKHSPNTQTMRQAIHSPELSRYSVLLVDDDELSLDIMSAMLTCNGVEHVRARGGVEAMEIIYKNRDAGKYFDIILLDYMMEGLNGIETARQIQTSLSVAPKLLMVTAYQRQLLMRELKDSGIDDVIEKPFIPSQFINKLCETVGIVQEDGKRQESEFTVYRGVKILLCEDYPLNQEVAAGMIAQFGIKPDIAGNGKQALDMLEGGAEYDLIFMDLQMPVMDGYEAARRIRAQEKYDHVPIISLTADAMLEVVNKCLEAGMNDHLAKPIEFSGLNRVFLKWLPEEKRVLDFTLKTPVSGARTDGLARFGGRADLYEKALVDFARTIPDKWPDFHYAANENREETLRLIHTLKGVSGNLSVLDIYAGACELEASLRSDKPDEYIYERFILACDVYKNEHEGKTESHDELETGTEKEFWEIFNSLREALCEYDPVSTTQILQRLMAKRWPVSDKHTLDKLYEFAGGYQFKEARQMIDTIEGGGK